MRNASFNDRQKAFKARYALGRSILTPELLPTRH